MVSISCCLPRMHKSECSRYSLRMDELAARAHGFLRGQWKGKASEIGSYILTEFRKCIDSADEFKSFLRNVDKFGPPVLPGA